LNTVEEKQLGKLLTKIIDNKKHSVSKKSISSNQHSNKNISGEKGKISMSLSENNNNKNLGLSSLRKN
jgi:hypothetical protein